MSKSRSRSLRSLGLEHLEGRSLLATFTVDTLSDADDGNTSAGNFSIREAITAANNTLESDIIAFKSSLSGTITLSGTLGISFPLTIKGPGADRLTISGDDAVRVFAIFAGAHSDIRGLTIANGAQTGSNRGAGLDIAQADVLLQECAIVDNHVEDIGGGIHHNGPGNLTLVNCTLSGNSANRDGGGIGLVVGANLRLINSTVSGNSAAGAGGGVSMIGGTATVVNSTITKNRANADDADPANLDLGGAFGNSNVLLNNSIVAGNLRGSAAAAPDDLGSSFVDSASANSIVGDANTAGGLADDTNNNIVGVGGAGTLNTNTVISANLVDNGGPTRTHNLVSGSPAIDSGSNALALDHLGVALARDQRGAFRKLDGDGNSSAIVDRGAVELGIRPALTLSGSISYKEGDPAKQVANTATLTDDAPTFTRLTVTISVNATADDRLAIRNQGTAAGQIGASGSDVTFGGVKIGTRSGGSAGAPLVVTLNASATQAATQALVRNVTFQTLGDNPSTASRTVRFVVADNKRLESPAKTRTVTITAVNDPPSLSLSGTISYQRDQAAIILAAGAAVSDVDSPNFAGGRLRVRITTGASATNRLLIGGGFTLDASNNLKLGDTIIGKRTSSGFGTNELIVTFNSSATLAIVQQLTRAIAFKTVGGAAGTRTVVFTVSDGDGGLSTEATKTVNVI